MGPKRSSFTQWCQQAIKEARAEEAKQDVKERKKERKKERQTDRRSSKKRNKSKDSQQQVCLANAPNWWGEGQWFEEQMSAQS